MNMVVIAIGVAIAAYGEVNFVAIGVAQQLSSLVFEATRLMLVQVRELLPHNQSSIPRAPRKLAWRDPRSLIAPCSPLYITCDGPCASTWMTHEADGGLCQQVLMNSQGISLNPIQSLYYVSPACLLCLSIPWTVVELPLLLERESWVALSPWVLLANAATAFALNLAGAWARGPLPHRPCSHTSRGGA
jgi:hypothetical protein